MRKRLITAIIALSLALCCLVGVTMAWLMDSTNEVTNTFTVGDVNIELIEHAYNEDDTDTITNVVSNTNEYPLIPGTIYAKDPTVTVKANSEDCYLFIKVTETNNPLTYLEYTIDETVWTKLENGVYYRLVSKDENDQSWGILTNNQVKVRENVVKPGTTGNGYVEMPAASAQPVLSFKAYAVQSANVADASAAWGLVKNT